MTQALPPLIALAVLILAIAATGYFVFQYGKEAIKREKQGELAAIATFKTNQIVHWIAERRADAIAFGRNSFLAAEAEEWLQRGAPSDETGRRILARLKSLTDSSGYRSVTLVDTQGQVRSSTDGRLPVEYPTHATAIESMDTRTPLLSELYRASSGEIAIDLVSPLLVSKGAETRTVGALVLTINPHQYLFPLIESWPAYTQSGETLLVRREGDEVIFLNELRHGKDSALRLRRPLTEAELPAAMAVRGQEGVVEGRDYRGVRVLAALHKIPGSPWFMVAKIDTDEAYGGIRTLAWTVTTLVGVFVAVAGLVIMLWWRQQRAHYLATEYRLALEREALVRHFDYLAKYANDIILLLDEQGRTVEVNDAAVSTYGYTRDELLQHHIGDLCAPETLADSESQFRRAAEPGGVLFETVHRRKDGTPFPVEVSSRTFVVEGRTFQQSIIRVITERKRAEEALRESERRLNRSQEIAHLGSWELDVVNDRLTWSDEAYRIFGLRPQEFGASYAAFLDRVHPDDRAAVDAAYTGSLRENRDTYEIEHRIIRKHSGEVRYVHEKCEHFRDTAGRIIRSVGMVHDITERRQAEEALRRERDFAESLIETAQAIVLVLDPEGRIVRFNPFMEAISGYRLQEVQGQDWFTTFLPASDRSSIREVFSRGISDTQTRGNINPIVTRDGQMRHISWSDKTLRDSHGHTLGLLSIGHDITDIRRAEAALRDREELLETILASAGEGIFGMDLEGRFTFANRAAVELLGYRNEHELLGQDVHQLIHHTRADGTPYPKEDCPMYRARGRNTVIHVNDAVLWRANRSHFPSEYSSYPIIRDDRVVGAVVTFIDVTERMVKEAQLLQAQKMEAVGQLTGGIAHDFNNLLTVILGNLDLLADGIPGDANTDVRELIMDALSAARDGAELTHRLLAFSREHPLQTKLIDINEHVSSIRPLLQRTLREDIELRIHADSDAPPVRVDPAQLESALLNLVINARDAMPTGGALTIETARQAVGPNEIAGLTPGNYVTITVSDSGVGMSPAVASRVFEPFFTTKERGKGSGLGLSMVYNFAKRSNGTTILRSTFGKGTTVSLLLPDAGSHIEAESRDKRVDGLPGGSETILLVEDEPLVRKLAKRSLLGLGYNVLEAENAAEAVKVVEGGAAVDLLVSDIIMPGPMKGPGLARWILQRCPRSKVLLTTGFSEAETGEPSVDKGDFHLLRKPYTKKELAAAVRAVLDAEAIQNSPQ